MVRRLLFVFSTSVLATSRLPMTELYAAGRKGLFTDGETPNGQDSTLVLTSPNNTKHIRPRPLVSSNGAAQAESTGC